MTDWLRNTKLLLENSELFVRALFAENEQRGDVIVAVGYVFEFGRGQLCFEMCANTRKANATPTGDRWNSGDYDYPGAVQDRFGGWSEPWWNELTRLDLLAANEEASSVLIHERVSEICCEVIAELAKRGVFGDRTLVDFNVSALLEDLEQVKKRDKHIRELIKSSA